MTTLAPRVVVVSRPSELDELLRRHGTRAAAAYFLRQRGRDLDLVAARHAALHASLTDVANAIPAAWRRGHVDRDDLHRFLFGPEDIVVAVGQDGLVANVAKYLDGQPVIGVNPEPEHNPGVLVRHPASAVGGMLPEAAAGAGTPRRLTMVSALLDDGQELIGLNEVYFGHPTHQSSRYVIATPDGASERHSSSGVVIGTGTGSTGWCASISRQRADSPALPEPQEAALCWFVREAWPSPATSVARTAGRLAEGEQLELTSEGERAVVFADGVETDHLSLAWGQRVAIRVATRRLNLL